MKHLHIITCLSVALLMVACAEVDLCESKEHPHSACVKFSFDMSEVSLKENEHIDTMGIIAYKIVGQWKSLIKTALNGNGNFVDIGKARTTALADGIINNTSATDLQSESEQEETTSEKPNKGNEVSGTEPGQPMFANSDKFKVKPGDYKFLAFTMDTAEIDCHEIYEYVSAPAMEKLLSDVCVSYRLFRQNDPHLKEQLHNWDDYNPYSGYVQPQQRPIIYDIAPLETVKQGQVKTINLKPHTKMQHVNIDFDIVKKVEKEPFIIDSVWMEISGIPVKTNLTNQHLDISKTAKTMAKMKMSCGNNASQDHMTNTNVSCKTSLDINGVVTPTDSEKGAKDASKRNTGPGLLQVIIFTHSNEISAITGKPKRKRFQGIINLYNTLKKSPSVKLTQDGLFAELNSETCNIHIANSILIDGENIKSYSTDDGGIENWDKWEPTSKDELIIEI